jgi:hypothetical protein
MKILAFFTSSGTPVLGLTPTIRIRDLFDNSLVITDANMSEVGDGNYQYDFVGYDKDTDYAVRCDGGIILSESDRYTYAGNENFIEDISESITENTSGGFSNLSTQIDEVNTNVLAVSASLVDISDDIKRLLGLVHENIFIDNPVYSGDGDLTSARLRIYSNPASVGTTNDVIGTYTISAPTSAPGQFTTWKQVRI